MMMRDFTLRLSFGDGQPIAEIIKAKNGVIARDIAMSKYPAARNVYIVSTTQTEDHPLFGQIVEEPMLKSTALDFAPLHMPSRDRNHRVAECLALRKEGKSHLTIAGTLGVAKTTVGRWIKQYG